MAEYKHEMERLGKEMDELKRKWFDAKKREQVCVLLIDSLQMSTACTAACTAQRRGWRAHC